MASLIQTVFDKTLNSVPFGIALMALVAAYIAVGSGLPAVREYFEMNELMFFNAWPLKVLMALLVLNLAVVTWVRIPLTPPRYGVWMIHIGIITLVFGLSFYYRHKTEGLTRVFVGQTVGHFYDTWERALYVRYMGRTLAGAGLPSLPRFAEYGEEFGNAGRLDRKDLTNIRPGMMLRDEKGEVQSVSLAELQGSNEELRIDITGYWPYAQIQTGYRELSSAGLTGLRVTVTDPHSGEPFQRWLVGSSAADAFGKIDTTDLEHRDIMPEKLPGLIDAASKVHKVTATLKGAEHTFYVEPGKDYPLGESGYVLSIERADPRWPMFGTGEIVQALILMVKSPAQEYRRMVLAGKDVQTDFDLQAEGAGPMGKRQTEPLDKDLVVAYAYEDPFLLVGRSGGDKYTIVTAGEKTAVIRAGVKGPSDVRYVEGGRGVIELSSEGHEGHGHAPTKVEFVRHDNLARNDAVIAIPKAQRDRDAGASGGMQVVRARVSKGDWSQEVFVPYSMDAGSVPWQGGWAEVPDIGPIQLQLGQQMWPLPAQLTLEKFELVPYAGGDPALGSIMRDFRSRLRIEDPERDLVVRGTAHMNNPIYFDSGRWLFFQASWDPENQQWSGIGVGNRPGVWVMTAGCVLITVGLLYAFYVKPIILRRMKLKALAAAAEAKAKKPPTKPAEPAMA